jgi:hypothetical protein
MSDLMTAGPVPRSAAQLAVGARPPAVPGSVEVPPPGGAAATCGVARGRLRAAELMRVQPDQSLRQIAARAGVAVGTVRDVRERVRRGLHPVPDHVRPVDGAEPEDGAATEGRRGSGRSPGYVLGSLRRNPSLRLSQSGRRLLGLLAERSVVDSALDEVVAAVPVHCAEAVVELMRHNADEWLRLAREVEQRAAAQLASGAGA